MAEQPGSFGGVVYDGGEAGTGEDIWEGVDGVGRVVGKHGRHQQAVPVQVKSHLELPQQLNVLLAMCLGEDVSFEDMGKDGGSEDTSIRT